MMRLLHPLCESANALLCGRAGPIIAGIAIRHELFLFIGNQGHYYRTWQEDRLLIADMLGYREYTQQTRYWLLPGIW
ncbi:MAG: hypothetical protein ACUVWR_08685 [Anaerolineae bacterium]